MPNRVYIYKQHLRTLEDKTQSMMMVMKLWKWK